MALVNTMKGTVNFLGKDQTDGLVNLIIKAIQLARVDATGDVKNAGGPTAKAYWQQDAIAFLQSLNELRADIVRR